MTNAKRWLEELPPGAPERDLLLAGRGARAPLHCVDESWQALSLALGTTVTAGAAAANSAVHAAAAKTAAGAVGHAATAGSFAVGVKWFVTGVVLGCGVTGAAAVVERVGHGPARQASSETATPATEQRAARLRGARERRAPLASPGPGVAATEDPAAVAVRAHDVGSSPPSFAARREAPTTQRAAPGALEPSSAAPSQATALSEQARELAEVKRLIDAGDAARALARLEAGGHGGPLVLSEERDALYVQALAAARRGAEARALARAFLARYPESPYLAAMRALLTND